MFISNLAGDVLPSALMSMVHINEHTLDLAAASAFFFLFKSDIV